MLVDNNAAFMLLTKKLADAHGLTMKEMASKYISGVNSMVVQIVVTTSITVLLMPTLGVDVANVVICLGDLYQGLLGCDVLCRHNEAVSSTTIVLPGPD